jgi:enoyl-CoA hydratase/carnithine racemase
MAALSDALAAIAEDRSVRVVIIAAAGRSFCAGHDLREMRANPEEAAHRAVFSACSRLMLAITQLPQPVIAAVQGVATAAGCQLVATCDLAFAAQSARFATPGVNIGLFCSTPMVALSRAVSRKAAMAMLLTGEMITAAEAERLGLINAALPDAALQAHVREVASLIARKSSLTLKIGKQAFYQQAEMTLPDAYAFTAEVMTRNMLTHDAAEGIDAFLQRRAPNWTGA